MDYIAEQISIYNDFANSGDAVGIDISISTLGTFDNATDSFATSVDNYSSYCFLSDCKREEWDQIMTGDKVLKIPAYGLPRLDELDEAKIMEFVQGGKLLKPAQIKTVEPGGTALLYIIQVRRC